MLAHLRSRFGKNIANDLLWASFLLLGVLNSQSRLFTTSKQVSSSIVVFGVGIVIVIIAMVVLVG